MITKSNLTITVDSKVLENFNRIKGDSKISHLVQDCLSDFIEKKERSTTKHHQGGKSS